MKRNKTLSALLALVGGPFGLHRYYLMGWRDPIGWLLPVPSLLGLYGLYRVHRWGLDDHLSWLLIPLLGFTFAGCALNAIVYGLMTPQQWNHKFNPLEHPESAEGCTNWLTVGAIVLSLLVGTAVLMASIAFSFQRYFEYRAE